MPDFIVEPSYCPVRLSLTVTPLNDQSSAITISSDNKVANFLYVKDLKPAEQNQFQTVTVRATSDSIYARKNQVRTSEGSWRLTFLSPCCIPDKVRIVAPSLTVVNYELYKGEKVYRQPAWTLQTTVNERGLCGSLAYVATFNGQIENQIADPFGYTPAVEGLVAIDSSDSTLAGREIPWTVTAQFANWGSCQSVTAESTVRFTDGCGQPSGFTATEQPSVSAATYSSQAISLDVNKFEISPSDCVVDYKCKAVTGPSGTIANGCNDNKFRFNDCSGENPATCDPSVDVTCTVEDYQNGVCPPGKYCVQFTGTAT